MQKHKKQILGCLGLGIVAAITAIAVALPTPDANAISDINLRVEVHSETPSLVLQEPLDGAEYTGPQIPISNIYSKIATIYYKLTYVDSAGNRTDYSLPEFTAATSGTADGINNWTLDLNSYGGRYGQYILTTESGAASDYVSFTYNSVGVVPGGTTTNPTTGNPVIAINYSDDVCSLKFQAYNKATGAALFNPEYVYTIPTPRPTPNRVNVELPFAQYKADAGDYRVVTRAFGCGNNQDTQIGDQDDTDINNYQPKDDSNVTTNQNGDPNIRLDFNFPVEVCVIKFQAFNKTNGAAVFQPEFSYTVDPPVKSGIIDVALPFANNDAESGNYRIVATFYDCNSPANILGTKTLDFDNYVKSSTPGVPNTGNGIFAGLNFSRKDYLITGLVVFMLALIIAFRLMAKSKKNDRR